MPTRSTSSAKRSLKDMTPRKEPKGGKPKHHKTVVSGGVLNGKAISKPQPAYPPIA